MRKYSRYYNRARDKKNDEKMLIQKIDWALNRQLTWAGLFLASLIGYIEILISFDPITTDGFDINIFLYETIKNVNFWLYLLLIFFIWISMNQLFKSVLEIVNREKELRQINSKWGYFRESRSEFINIIIDKNTDNQKTENTKEKIKRKKGITYLINYLIVFFSMFFYIIKTQPLYCSNYLPHITILSLLSIVGDCFLNKNF
jgi:hypothetical protein